MKLRDSFVNDYFKCLSALKDSGVISQVGESENIGILNDDGCMYPVPSISEIEDLFSVNSELVNAKIAQGFCKLELAPLAAGIPFLIDKLTSLLIKKSTQEQILETSNSQNQIPVKVNREKQVWPWEKLLEADRSNEIAYFPKQYKSDHGGMTKKDALLNPQICASPGWSVGLVEDFEIMPAQGDGKTIGGRKKLEVGNSPNEYRQILSQPEYFGETGKTLEDFLTEFIVNLITLNRISNNEDDLNGLWCLGQYVRLTYADVVPAGRWVGRVGRLRLDMHRSNNKKCTSMIGASTVVRLPRKNLS